MKHGLNITLKSKYDPRRLKRSPIFGGVDILDIPDFDLMSDVKIKNQGNSQLCTAFSNTTISEVQEGVELSPEYAYQKTNLLMGVKHSNGADPDSAFKVHTKFGCIEKEKCPFTLDNNQYDIEDPNKWDLSLDEWAKVHKKNCYLECDQGNDRFDSIISAMWQSYQYYKLSGNKRDIKAVSVGMYWSFQSAENGIVVDKVYPKGGGHNVVARGLKTINGIKHIIIQNSYGENVGDKGLYYFPRSVVNKYTAFAKTFEDLNPEIEKQYQWSVFAKMLDYFVKSLKSFVDNLKPEDIKPEIKMNKLNEFCLAIQEFEGYKEGSRSFRNHNPGNLKYTGYTKSLGAISKDKDNFCVFLNYEKGLNALKQFVIDARNNQLKKYHDCTIQGFFDVYAPSSDKNYPVIYAKFVANKCGVIAEAKLAEIIN